MYIDKHALLQYKNIYIDTNNTIIMYKNGNFRPLQGRARTPLGPRAQPRAAELGSWPRGPGPGGLVESSPAGQVEAGPGRLTLPSPLSYPLNPPPILKKKLI